MLKLSEPGVVPAEGIEFTIRADNVRATTIDAILVPGPRIHERLNQETEGVRFVELELAQEFAKRLGIATAFHKVLQFVANFRAQESLEVAEINEITNGAHLTIDFEKVPDCRAVGIAAREWSE